MSSKIPSKAVRTAMSAHTDLFVYGAVVELLEGGLLSGPESSAKARIIAICRKEQARQLRIMDKAVAATSAKKGGAQ